MACDLGEVVGAERCRRVGKLREEAPRGVDELVGDLADRFDLHAHGQECTGPACQLHTASLGSTLGPLGTG
jgi:hypothetical protein